MARRFGFSHKLEHLNETRSPLQVTQAPENLSAAFRFSQVSREAANNMRTCKELVRRVGILRATVQRGTHAERYLAQFKSPQSTSGDEEKTSTEAKNEDEMGLSAVILRFLVKEVVNAVTAMVSYAVELPPQTLAEIMNKPNFEVILQELVKLEDNPGLSTVSHRQNQLKNLKAFEILFNLLAVYSLGQSAKVALDKYESKAKRAQKRGSRRDLPDPNGCIDFLREQIQMANEYHIDANCPVMQDALHVLEYLEHVASKNPVRVPHRSNSMIYVFVCMSTYATIRTKQIDMRPYMSAPTPMHVLQIPPPVISKLHYREICRVLYSFIRILCKNNSATALYCARYGHIMLHHFSLGIGALDTFSEVVDNNLDLLQSHLTKDHIAKYVEMLWDKRMHPERLEQLQRFCSYQDIPISRVQVRSNGIP